MHKFKISNLLIGILFTLLFISLGVIAAVNLRFIYYMDIDVLNISESSGLTKEVIKDNYDALIDYNSPFFKGDLKFPSLPSSKEGLQHFVEVKNIFVSFYYIALVSLLMISFMIIDKFKKKDYSFLLTSSITVLVLPIIVAIGSVINFDAAFVLFHKIFFRNDYWIFDPETDPIINLLPDTYFLHCLIVIIVTVFIGSFFLFLLWRYFKRKNNI